VKRRRIKVNWFFVAIFAAMAVASLVPATGVGATIVNDGTTGVIGVLFFLYGLRLSPAETIAGLRHWRLHLTILSATYIVFPLIGLGLSVLLRHWMTPTLVAGIIYLSLVPSTIQTSVTFTSIAHGNVAGAVVSASASNLLGVFLTPLLCWLVLSHDSNLTITPRAILSIVAEIIVPFILGQVCRRWLATFVAAHPKLSLVDQAAVVLIVYSAFSSAMTEGVWHLTSFPVVMAVIGLCLGCLVVMLVLTWYGAKALGFSRADAIAIQFCGTKKSLASGLPIAGVLFAGTSLALVVLPLIIFHQLQLLVCGTLAARYGRAVPPEVPASE